MRLYMAASRWLLLFLIPAAALAVGLGEIRLDSSLNQPFSAEIPLESVEASELLEMEVALASRETFDRYGLDRPAFLSDFRFAVDTDANGNPIIRVSSLKSVSEPFVTFLLDMRWGSGRLLREYTVLLDPPLFDNEVVQPTVAAAQTGTVSESEATGQIVRPGDESAYQDSDVVAPTGLFQAEDASAAPEPQSNLSDTAVSETRAQSRAAPRGQTQAPVGVAQPSGSYRTQRGDTLWRIAERMRGNTGLTNNQMMLALYRANPGAFMGNINSLKAGAILRMPAEAGVDAPGISEANNEVKQQNSAWQGGAAAVADGGEARLQLVAPGSVEEPQVSGAGSVGDSAAGQAETGRLQERIGQLEAELGESQRLLQLRDAELQALQERINALEQDAGEAGEVPAEGAEPGQIFVDETGETEPVDVGSEAAVETPAASVEAAGTQSDTDEDGMLGSIWLWAGAAMALLLVAFMVVRRRQASAESAGSAAWADEMPAVSADETVEDFSDLEPIDGPIIVDESEDAISDADATQDDRRVSDFAPDAESDAFGEDALTDFSSDDVSVFEDDEGLAGSADASDAMSFDEEDRGAGETELPLEKTISTGAPLNLDQADPIAEAEFHMAYGLYDQAADLLVNALGDEPDNRAYRVKLLEVYFVWENKEGFLEQARALHESIGDTADSDWSKVLILGKQLCPEDSLFTGASPAAPISGSMDLELSEGGANETALDFALDGDGSGDDQDSLDFEIGSDDANEDTGESGVTLNLGRNPFEDDGATMESPTVDIDFADFGEDSEGATMESPTIESPFNMGDDDSEGATMESPTIESPFNMGDADSEGATMESPTIESPFNMGDSESDDAASTMETPTVESPVMDQSPDDDDSVVQPTSLEVDLSGLTDLPVDDLDGIADADQPIEDDSDSADDIFGSLSDGILDESADGDLGADTLPASPDEEAWFEPESKDFSSDDVDENIGKGSDDETGFASLEALGDVAGSADSGFSQAGGDDSSWPTSGDETAEQPDAERQGGGDTAVQPQVDSVAGDTSMQPVISDSDEMDLDLELGDLSDEAVPEEAVLASDDGLLLPDDATMTEVGTKLDLARAYIDMGDPDGARSILEEVLDEGGESQQQEARQLLDELSD